MFPKLEYPEANKLIKDNELVYVEIKDGVIRGFNQTHFFETSNDFKDFTTRAFTSPTKIYHHKVSGNNVAMWSGGLPGDLTYSHDFGHTVKTIKFPIPITHYMSGHGHGCEDVHWVDNNTLLLVTVRAGPSSVNTLSNLETFIWKLNLATNNMQLISSIPGFYEGAVNFSTPNHGWIVLARQFLLNNVNKTQNTNLAITDDGGKSWTTPVLIDSFTRHSLKRGSDNHLFLHHYTDSGYFSTDGGIHWNKPKTSPGLNSVHVFNASSLYGVENVDFYKSTDGGATWNKMPELDPTRGSLGILNMVNEQTGVSFYHLALFVTRDGGKNWKRLIYPE